MQEQLHNINCISLMDLQSQFSHSTLQKKKFRSILETNSDQLDMTFFGKTDTNTFLFIWQNRSQSVYTCSDGSSKHLNGLLIHLKKHRFNALAKTLILNSLLILVNGNLVNGVSVIRIV